MNETNIGQANPSSKLVPIKEFVDQGGSSSVSVPTYEMSALTIGMAHIGLGNFHRVHQGTYLEEMLHIRADHTQWGILGIELL